jgi:hypothetical protein
LVHFFLVFVAEVGLEDEGDDEVVAVANVGVGTESPCLGDLLAMSAPAPGANPGLAHQIPAVQRKPAPPHLHAINSIKRRGSAEPVVLFVDDKEELPKAAKVARRDGPVPAGGNGKVAPSPQRTSARNLKTYSKNENPLASVADDSESKDDVIEYEVSSVILSNSNCEKLPSTSVT